jgi:hypothetical protein
METLGKSTNFGRSMYSKVTGVSLDFHLKITEPDLFWPNANIHAGSDMKMAFWRFIPNG